MSDDDLTIPAFLRRKDTTESRAERERLNHELRRGGYRPVADYRQTVSAGASETKLTETTMAKIGKKEAALREARGSDVPELSKLFPFGGKGKAKKPAPKPKAAVTETTDISMAELNMAPGEWPGPLAKEVDAANERIAEKSEKKAAAKPVGKPGKAAKAPAKGKTAPEKKPAGKAPSPKAGPKDGYRPDGLREGSKQAVMLDMAKKGATEKEICKKLGWKKCRVTLGRVVKRVGMKLEAKKTGDVTTYFAK